MTNAAIALPHEPPSNFDMDPATAQTHAKVATEMMQRHKVAPLPECYAIFFHYAAGDFPAMNAEIDVAIKQNQPFSTHLLRNLYNKYIVSGQNEDVLNEITQGVAKAMEEVLRVVGDFSQETTSYNKDIDGYLQQISIDIPDTGIKGLVKKLISSTTDIRSRGETLNSRLEESRLEIDTLKSNIEQLREESQRDFLTGTFNRKALERNLEAQLAHHAASKQDLSLLMLDVDHFKQFNDRYGHLMGDEVLKIVSRAITFSVRGKDMVARYGGEEFCVILPDTPLMGAMKVAETIRNTIAKRDLKRKDTGESFGHITVSIGASLFRPRTDSLESFIRRADDALYKSKHTGRNKVTAEWELE